MTENVFDLIVIGEGVAGLTAAQHAARAGVRTATFEGQCFGGLVLNINELDPAPDKQDISGSEFAAELSQANADLGVVSIQNAVSELRQAGDSLEVITDDTIYRARQILVASGARFKTLGIPGEAEFAGRGVSHCADCDAPIYQGEDVVVIGGGDSALQEALILAKFCRKVYLVHRGARLRAQPRFIERITTNPKISTMWNAQVERIEGGNTVEKVFVKLGSDRQIQEVQCAGVFIYIGLAPNSEFLPPQIERDSTGFVLTTGAFETTLPGVRAVGAIRYGYSGLLHDAIAEARRAAQAVADELLDGG